MGKQGEHEMLHQLIFTKLVGEIDYGAGAQGFGEFNAAGYNVSGVWAFNDHDGDWIYQGGPDSSAVKKEPYFNQWADLDSSPQQWQPPVMVDPASVDPWLFNVGGGIY